MKLLIEIAPEQHSCPFYAPAFSRANVPGDDKERVGGAEESVLVGQTDALEGRDEVIASVRVRLHAQLQLAATLHITVVGFIKLGNTT